MPPVFFTKPVNTHPRPLAAVGELPASLAEAAQPNLPQAGAVNRIFFVPADYRSKPLIGYRYIPEQALIFTDRGVLHVLAGASRDTAPVATFIGTDCLLYSHSSLLLLYGRLELAAIGRAGVETVVVEYNTVGWHLLEPSLKGLIAAAGGAPQVAVAADARVRAEHLLQALPYKFANGLRIYGLTAGETLRGVVFQPSQWLDGPWGFWQRQVTPNTLLALTDCHLIIIEEDRALFRRAAGRVEYGWIVSHFPLRVIAGATTASHDIWHELTIAVDTAPAAVHVARRVLLDEDTAHAWDALWAAHKA